MAELPYAPVRGDTAGTGVVGVALAGTIAGGDLAITVTRPAYGDFAARVDEGRCVGAASKSLTSVITLEGADGPFLFCALGFRRMQNVT